MDWISQEMKDIQMKAINNQKDYTTKQVSILGVKFILDGAAAGQTAVMVDPYEGSKDYRGPWCVTPEQFKEKLIKYDKLGYTVKAHCAGDGATRLVLDSVEELYKIPGNNAAKLRHSAAHAAFVQPDDIARFAKFGV